MDIQIVDAQVQGDFLITKRTCDGAIHLRKEPKIVLAIRAAEYNLDVDDPFVLDMILMEPFIRVEDEDEIHPLYAADTVFEAGEILRKRVDDTQELHGAPTGPLRVMAKAIEAKKATQGLVVVQKLLLQNADKRVRGPIQTLRDRERNRMKKKPVTFLDRLVWKAEQENHRATAV